MGLSCGIILSVNLPKRRQNMAPHNKALKFVPALRASTGPKKAAPFWAAKLKRYVT